MTTLDFRTRFQGSAVDARRGHVLRGHARRPARRERPARGAWLRAPRAHAARVRGWRRAVLARSRRRDARSASRYRRRCHRRHPRGERLLRPRARGRHHARARDARARRDAARHDGRVRRVGAGAARADRRAARARAGAWCELDARPAPEFHARRPARAGRRLPRAGRLREDPWRVRARRDVGDRRRPRRRGGRSAA